MVLTQKTAAFGFDWKRDDLGFMGQKWHCLDLSLTIILILHSLPPVMLDNKSINPVATAMDSVQYSLKVG